MKIIINGINGRMGSEVAKLALEGYRGAELIAGVDINPAALAVTCYADFGGIATPPDCIIDFSHHSTTRRLLDYCVSQRVPVVIATTGQTADELLMIDYASKEIPVFRSANMSLGVALLVELAKITAKTMLDADIEIIEKHHNRKLDSPSGTALLIAEEIKSVREKAFLVCGRSGQGKRDTNEIGISAVRLGNIIGEHEVIVGNDTQTITLKHEAHTRSLFAEGAIAAAAFLVGQGAGLYSMQDMISS